MRASFTILGSASGMPQPDRACSGYLLERGENLSRIDCGGGVTSSFLLHGFDPRRLDRVFISHTHSDHVGDLALLIQLLHGVPTERRLDVYLPDEFVEPFKDYLNAVYLIPDRLSLELCIHGYKGGLVYDDCFRLTALANTHQTKLASDIQRLGLPNKMQCFSFRIDADGGSLFYSADVGSFDDVRPHLKELDYALVETTHIQVQQLLDHAASSSVKRYILTHLGGSEEVIELQQKIAGAGISNLVLADDGMRLDL